jgi:hypothetical protein
MHLQLDNTPQAIGEKPLPELTTLYVERRGSNL